MTDAEFLRSLVLAVARRGTVYVRPALGDASSTLLEALRTEVRPSNAERAEVALHVPHYWAYFVHRGRNAPLTRENPVMVWFRNPLDDPRLVGGRTPQRVSELRRLSRADFLEWSARNREARAAGLPEPMVVRRTVRRSTAAKPFFSDGPGGGMDGFFETTQPLVQRRIARHFADRLREISRDLMPDDLVLDL